MIQMSPLYAWFLWVFQKNLLVYTQPSVGIFDLVEIWSKFGYHSTRVYLTLRNLTETCYLVLITRLGYIWHHRNLVEIRLSLDSGILDIVKIQAKCAFLCFSHDLGIFDIDEFPLVFSSLLLPRKRELYKRVFVHSPDFMT